MARSSYVYVVIGRASRLPVAAFTVKHELIRWLIGRNGHSMLRVFRVGDGCYCDARSNDGCKVEVDIEYMIDNPTRAARVLREARPQ